MKIVGYLKKKKTQGFFKNLIGKTNLRYFECSFSQETLGYKNSEKDTQFLKIFDFEDITAVIDKITEDDMKASDWKHGFKITIDNNLITLFAKEEEEKKNWIMAIKKVLEINKFRPKDETQPNEYENTEDKHIRQEKMNYIKHSINFYAQIANNKKLKNKGIENLKKYMANLNAAENQEKNNDPLDIKNNNQNRANKQRDDLSSLNLSNILEMSNKDLDSEEAYNEKKYETLRKKSNNKNVELFPNPDDMNCWDMYDTKGNQLYKKVEAKEKKLEICFENLNFNDTIPDKEKRKNISNITADNSLQNKSSNSQSNFDPELDKKLKIDAKKLLVDSIKILNNYQERNTYTAAKNLKEMMNNQQYSNNYSRDSNRYEVIGAAETTMDIVNKSYKIPMHHREYISPEKISEKDIYGNVDESVINFFKINKNSVENESRNDNSRLSDKIEFEKEIDLMKKDEENRKKRVGNILNKDNFNFEDDKNLVMSMIKKKSEITKVAEEIRNNPSLSKNEKKGEKNKGMENVKEDVTVQFNLKTGKDVNLRNELLDDWN